MPLLQKRKILDSLSKQVQLYLLSRSICAKRHVSFLDFIMHRLSVLFLGGGGGGGGGL